VFCSGSVALQIFEGGKNRGLSVAYITGSEDFIKTVGATIGIWAVFWKRRRYGEQTQQQKRVKKCNKLFR
jgi:hypothetical protein